MLSTFCEGVNNYVSLDFFLSRFLPTIISRKPSIYKGLWALPTPGLWNKVEGQRHKIKNTTLRRGFFSYNLGEIDKQDVSLIFLQFLSIISLTAVICNLLPAQIQIFA